MASDGVTLQFYILEDLGNVPYATQFVSMKPRYLGEAPTCPECGEYVGKLPWLPPYRVEIQAYGRAPGDVAYLGASNYFVSERFRDAWIKEGLRGIDSFDPLERLRIRPARMDHKGATYFHIAPRRFQIKIDPARSHIVYQRPSSCSMCRGGDIKEQEGFSIDESTWTGEDIFQPWGTHDTVVSDRVRQLRDDYKLTNVNLVPTEIYCVNDMGRWYIKGEEPYADRHEERFTGCAPSTPATRRA